MIWFPGPFEGDFDSATWIKALVGGKVLNADNQRSWLASVKPEDPAKPDGQQYGYGIAQLHWGSNRLYFHGGETLRFNSFMGYDPTSKISLVIWTNLTVSLDEQPTANTLMLKVLDQIYEVSPLPPPRNAGRLGKVGWSWRRARAVAARGKRSLSLTWVDDSFTHRICVVRLPRLATATFAALRLCISLPTCFNRSPRLILFR